LRTPAGADLPTGLFEVGPALLASETCSAGGGTQRRGVGGPAGDVLLTFQYPDGVRSRQVVEESGHQAVRARLPVGVGILDGPEIVEPAADAGCVRVGPVDLHRRNVWLVRGGGQLRVADRALGLLDLLQQGLGIAAFAPDAARAAPVPAGLTVVRVRLLVGPATENLLFERPAGA